MSRLKQSVIHGDMNDYNILVTAITSENQQISGFIDFGDTVKTATICELAIAAAYAMLNKTDPLMTAAHIVKGYHAVFPLASDEIDTLFDLICLRLCMSVVNSAQPEKGQPPGQLSHYFGKTRMGTFKKITDYSFAFRDLYFSRRVRFGALPSYRSAHRVVQEQS